MAQDIRWHQRLANFQLAMAELGSDIKIMKTRTLSTMEEKGLIKTFEFTFELAWNCLKDIAEHQGETTILGSRDAIRYAFKRGIIEQGDIWMDMVDSRIKTAHTYHRALAQDIAKKIIRDYYPEFCHLQEKLLQIKNKP